LSWRLVLGIISKLIIFLFKKIAHNEKKFAQVAMIGAGIIPIITLKIRIESVFAISVE
jgi:hypothetical protein